MGNDVSFSEYGYASKYFLGGNLIPPRKGSYAFPGLYEDELNVNQLMMLNLWIQFSPINKIYLIPHFNYASIGFNDFEDYIKDAFSPKRNWSDLLETSSLYSFGTTASYYLIIGPISFDVSQVNDINKVRVFFIPYHLVFLNYNNTSLCPKNK